MSERSTNRIERYSIDGLPDELSIDGRATFAEANCGLSLKTPPSRLAQAIIPMAGRASRLAPLLGGRPKSLVRVAGRPLLIWTMTQLIEQGIQRFILVIGAQVAEQMLKFLQHSFLLPTIDIVLVEQAEQLGPGHALACAAPALLAGSALVVLGDTFFSEPLPLEGDWVGVAQVAAGTHWCLVETDKQRQVQRFYDKCVAPAHVTNALVGLYHFEDAQLFADCTTSAIEIGAKIQDEYQISSVLERYHQQRPLSAHEVSTWQDCGTVANLTQVRRALFNTRAPNRIMFNPLGILTKHSSMMSLTDQIHWYQELQGPKALLAPRMIEADIERNCYQLEYVHLDSLADLYLYESLYPAECTRIFSGIIETLQHVLWPIDVAAVGDDLEQRCRRMYIEKMVERFGQWDRSELFLHYDRIEINGECVVGPREAISYLIQELDQVVRDPIPGFIHGDLHFSNILYACDLDYFRLIDPRGNFGGPPSRGGDIRYDLSKLRHSYHGLYDAIINDLFLVRELEPGRYQLDLALERTVYADLLDRYLESLGYDLRSIIRIEASLFLSMLPLHADHAGRQLSFLLIALRMVTRLMNGAAEGASI